ncbi:Actinohivin [Streptomyces hundungensis]|uniref:Actinohivin n=1 Tax=Streptomyces hundungensis TaxID=1077946 RepID=A0A387HSC6_9ACTN|nr:ricin-type beta-trefoil lectin domain protein [Streptomyces hundungensis]AYG85060.1 Actinohivin [Streptomyces hundungensis]
MLKRHLAKMGVVLAVPALVFAATAPAHASGSTVTWRNKATGGCLTSAPGDIVGTETGMLTCFDGANRYEVDWYDSQDNLENPNGAWTERVGRNGKCLTSYSQPGDDPNTPSPVYLETCSSPANYYEQWYEEWDGSSFHLRNRQTGRYLDTNSNGDVYALPANNGNYQRWN